MTTCTNCSNTIQNKYCGSCGQSIAMNGKIDLKDFLTDLFHSIFHTGGGLFYTLKLLFTKPELVMEGYIAGKRKVFFSPIKLFLICSVIYVAANHFVSKGAVDNDTKTIEYYFEHYKYLMTLGPVVLTALVNWLIYRRGLSFTENLIVSLYIQSVLYLLDSLFMMINHVANLHLIYIGLIITILFYGYAMSRFYNRKNIVFVFVNSIIYISIFILFVTLFFIKI